MLLAAKIFGKSTGCTDRSDVCCLAAVLELLRLPFSFIRPIRLDLLTLYPILLVLYEHGKFLPWHRRWLGAGHSSIDLRPASGQDFGKGHSQKNHSFSTLDGN
jgi:hypothetical protein